MFSINAVRTFAKVLYEINSRDTSHILAKCSLARFAREKLYLPEIRSETVEALGFVTCNHTKILRKVSRCIHALDTYNSSL